MTRVAMLGTEQAILQANFFKQTFYRLFGDMQMGEIVRFSTLLKALNSHDFSDCSILDVGCGKGIISFYFARRFPCSQVFSIDLDVRAIEKARSIVAKQDIRNLEFSVKSILDLDGLQQFDLIVCADVLEHIENDFEAIVRLTESLRRRGILVIHVPRKFQKHPFRNFEWRGHHVREGYVPRELINMLESVDLTILRRRHTFGIFGALADEIGYTLWRVKPIWIAFYPLLRLLAFLDVLATNSRGNGVLVMATKH